MLVAGNPSILRKALGGLLKRKRNNPEEQIQRAVVQHLEARANPGVVWWHTPNGGKRGKIAAAALKRLGVRRGVSDIVALYRGRMFALELKAEKGRPTKEQMQFISDVNTAGGTASIVVGLDQAIITLERWQILKMSF